MKIANGVYMLEIEADVLGKHSVVCPTLIWDGHSAVLIDTGYPGQLPQIREAMEKEGVPFGKLDTVILTHQDIDHVGSAAGIVNELKGACKVLAHEDEAEYIAGKKTPVKLLQLEQQMESLPDNMKMVYEKMKQGMRMSTVAVDRTLADGDELPFCGGIEVIHTPGHTPGHISLYLKHQKVLIAGDMMRGTGGMLMNVDPLSNLDTALSMKSLRKLLKYDIDAVICYHGGLFRGEIKKRIEELIGGQE
jgi:glyoxylase-like metal-dependent hydrolase (beta-lactamase superfamily II)